MGKHDALDSDGHTFILLCVFWKYLADTIYMQMTYIEYNINETIRWCIKNVLLDKKMARLYFIANNKPRAYTYLPKPIIVYIV